MEPVFGVVAEPKLWKGFILPEKIEVSQIATHANVQDPKSKVRLLYLYTNFQIGGVKFQGKNVNALAVWEMDHKMITEENIEKLYAEGRIIKMADKDATWSIAKTALAKFRELHCSQIAIVRPGVGNENGKYKALCLELDTLNYTSASTEWDFSKKLLLEMAKANLRAEGKMPERKIEAKR